MIDCKICSSVSLKTEISAHVYCSGRLPPSSPRCQVHFSERGWRTDRSDWLPPLLRCPSCNRWLTARRQAVEATRLSKSHPRHPLPSRCPIRPPLRSSGPVLPSHWTSCRPHPSRSCSSRSSAFSPTRWPTWLPASDKATTTTTKTKKLRFKSQDVRLLQVCHCKKPRMLTIKR